MKKCEERVRGREAVLNFFFPLESDKIVVSFRTAKSVLSPIVSVVILSLVFLFIYFIFTIYSIYLKRVISKRDKCQCLKQVLSIDGSLELI
jgi:hypothetical protein